MPFIFTFGVRAYFSHSPETVGQYTGKKRQKTVMRFIAHTLLKSISFLFDGSEYESELIGTVVYDNEYQAFCLTNIKHEGIKIYGLQQQRRSEKRNNIFVCFMAYTKKVFEIIGNIPR